MFAICATPNYEVVDRATSMENVGVQEYLVKVKYYLRRENNVIRI